jgi:hypothetical protein
LTRSLFAQVLVSDKVYESPLLKSGVVTTGLPCHDAERPTSPSLGDLGRRPTFNDLSGGDTLCSKSATGGSITNSCPIIASNLKPRYPPSDSDDVMILAQNSFSLVGDNSVDDDDEFNDSGSLDTLLSSTSCSTITTGTLPSSSSSKLLLSRRYGLGISGLSRKDGSGSFDGLGIVSIKSSAWRHDDDLPQSEPEMLLQFGDGSTIVDQSDSIQELFNQRQLPSSSTTTTTYDGSLDSEDSGGTDDTGISDVFLQETLLTFTQDPFHKLCHSISDCDNNNNNNLNNSWSDELGLLGLGDQSASTHTSMLANDNDNDNTQSAKEDSRSSSSSSSMMMLNYSRRRRVPKLNTNFSSATISSELKRSSTTVIPKKNWRHRSSSWPSSSTMDGGNAAATTPLPRCKWRL